MIVLMIVSIAHPGQPFENPGRTLLPKIFFIFGAFAVEWRCHLRTASCSRRIRKGLHTAMIQMTMVWIPQAIMHAQWKRPRNVIWLNFRNSGFKVILEMTNLSMSLEVQISDSHKTRIKNLRFRRSPCSTKYTESVCNAHCWVDLNQWYWIGSDLRRARPSYKSSIKILIVRT